VHKLIKIKFSADVIKFISMFETLTRAKVKDCLFVDEVVFFIVQPGQIGKAIGKKGINIKRLKSFMKNKEFRIVEFNPGVTEFVKNLFYPILIKNIELKEDVIEVSPPDLKSRGLIIGRGGQNLRNYEAIVNRYFNIREIKVVS